ncbi:MAG: hypothetical protein IPM29_03445 [Planctomycetes bacterium]|nr:hypothetical protein [Planctomycetota bacterium]
MLAARRLLPLSLLAAACASGPQLEVPQTPAAALDMARALLDADRPADARRVLSDFGTSDFVDFQLERYKLLRALALFRTDDPWDAFVVIRDFTEDHRFSDLSAEVEELHFQIGHTLIESDGGVWIFQSDRDDGEIVLQEFVERYPTSRFAADALHDLGELALTEESWSLARRRFEEIVQFHPNSEWVALSRFRIPQTAFADLVGPAYDLDAMERTRNELRAYLQTEPENPTFRSESERMLAVVLGWIAERHLLDADFYRTLGNEPGERFHLGLLLIDYPDDPLTDVARARLAELDAAAALRGAP